MVVCMAFMDVARVVMAHIVADANISSSWETHLVLKVETMLDVVPLFLGRVLRGKAMPLDQNLASWW